MADKPETDPMLAFFDARIAAWAAAKESYVKAASFGQPGTTTTSGSSAATFAGESKSIDLPVGALRGKSVPDAIKLFLSAGRRKQTNKEIAVGLKQGGLETTAGNFEANIAAALFRLKKAGIVLRFKDGWDLAEHYPDHLRSRLDRSEKVKASPVKYRTRGRARVRSGAKARISEKAKTIKNDEPSTDKTFLALTMIAANTKTGTSLDDVHKGLTKAGLACSRDYVRVVLKRLVKRGKIERRGDLYFAGQQPQTDRAA